MKNRFLLGTALILGTSLMGCINSSSPSGDKSGNGVDLSPLSEALYDLPSAITGQQGSVQALARTSGEEESLWDTYRFVPGFIRIAQEAKENVANFIGELNQYDIQENMDFTEDGMEIAVRTRDTTIAGAAQKFFVIRIRKDGQRVLLMNYWKNAREQYRGNLYFFQTEGADSGAAVFVHFNGHNAETIGQRLVVVYTQPTHVLVGDKVNDPAVVRVVALRRGDHLVVSGGSWHPNFDDADNFWEEGAKIYAFVAAANLATDRAVMRVAFATDTVDRADLFTEYSMDKRVLERGTVAFKTHIAALGNDTLIKMVLWSIENERPQEEGWSLLSSYEPAMAWDDITPAQVKAYLETNRTAVESDSTLLEFLNFISVEQPIYLRAGALFAGSNLDIPADFGLSAADLEDEELEVLSPTDIVDLSPEQIEEEASTSDF